MKTGFLSACIVSALVVAALSASPAAARMWGEVPPDVPPADLKDAAALYYPVIPTDDPCVQGWLSVEAQDYLRHGESSWIWVDAGRWNACTGEYVATARPLEQPLVIDENDFTVSHGYDTADLNVTVSVFDEVTQAAFPLTLDLHWASTGAASDALASVTGTITSEHVTFALDDSIQWYAWGSDEAFPWAGMWPCRFSPISRGGGCVGQ